MPKKPTESFLEIDLGKNGGRVSFSDLGSAAEFFNRQYNSAAANALRPIGGSMLDRLNVVREIIANYNNQGHSPQTLYDAMVQAFAAENRINFPTLESADGRWIQELADEQGNEAAVGAMAYYSGTVSGLNMNNPGHFTGVFAFLARSLGLKRREPAHLEGAFASVMERFSEQQNNFASAAKQLLEDMENEHNEAVGAVALRQARDRAVVKKGIRRAAQRVKIRTDEQFNQLEEARKDIRNVEETYRVQLGLQEPVAYWRTKSSDHKRNSQKYLHLLLMFAPSVIVVGVILFVIIAEAMRSMTAFSPSTVAYGALGLLLTTSVLWACRILVRLYMSEHHLAIDAEERATMVHTFLAMQLAGQLKAEDLQLILGPIFKPTSDGIIKDDAAPEIGLASLLSKAAGSR